MVSQGRPADFAERAAAIVAGGLPCRFHCRSDGGFTRLDQEPLGGWVHLADDLTVAEHLANKSHYHVSLSTTPVDEEQWQRVVERWHGVDIVISVHYVTQSGGAVLAWNDIGADEDVWRLYMEGSYSYKRFDNHYDLHISM